MSREACLSLLVIPAGNPDGCVTHCQRLVHFARITSGLKPGKAGRSMAGRPRSLRFQATC